MRKSVTITGGVALLTLGYVLGASQILSPARLLAQPGGGKKAAARPGDKASALVDVSDEAKTKIKAAGDALKAAADALTADGKFDSSIKGLNTFAVLTGGTGGQAMKELDAGVVDPETYAALYTGLAADNVIPHLGRDAEGRMTYKGKVVKMYPISLLRSKYAARAELTGEELLPTATEETTKAGSKKKAKQPDEETEEEQ